MIGPAFALLFALMLGGASIFSRRGMELYFVGLQGTSASVFFPLVQTQPLFAIVFSAFFLGQLEIITRWSAIGSGVIVAGATLIVLG